MDETPKKSRKLQVTLSWKSLAFALLLVLVGFVCYTKPWDTKPDTVRTVSVNGEATVKRVPDLFIFYPYYEESSQEAIVAKTNEVVTALKGLGLGDAGIQTSVSNYENYGSDGLPNGEMVYNASLTLTVDNKDVAQKVQDYLVSSGATGSITPTYDFTRETKKQLKDEASVLAIEDAKIRAEKQAQSLDAELGSVVNVTEPEDFEIYPVAMYDATLTEAGSTSLPIQAGENEFTYSVKVEFEIL